MELSREEVSSFMRMERGEMSPPGVVGEGAGPMVMPDGEGDSLDPGWKGLKFSNSAWRCDDVGGVQR